MKNEFFDATKELDTIYTWARARYAAPWGVLARLVWSPEMPLPEHLAARNIALAVAQRPDGSIITDNPHLAPAVYVFDTSHTVADARAVAKALTDAADLADLWIGGAR
ncbi:Uncharacterised protein [Mycobacteroides abscessus]|nr:Uncharacterised protein [Mycobacteroides abscessus]